MAEHRSDPDRSSSRLSGSQRFFTWLFPSRWAASMERESREWIVTCPECGRERSVWDLGGVRWKAKSKGRRQRMSCDRCGAVAWHRVERRPASQTIGGP